jgi:hypothetical protein
MASAAARSKSFDQSQLDDMLSGLLARVPQAVEDAIARVKDE